MEEGRINWHDNVENRIQERGNESLGSIDSSFGKHCNSMMAHHVTTTHGDSLDSSFM